jgi:hypothetical protein
MQNVEFKYTELCLFNESLTILLLIVMAVWSPGIYFGLQNVKTIRVVKE